MLNLKDYRDWLGTHLRSSRCQGSPPLPIDISTDSRTIREGQWFIAITGQNFDGHSYIETAISNGAAGIIAQETMVPKTVLINTIDHLLVDDTIAAFGAIARGWRLSFPEIKVIAITGSLGKTTTKEMLYSILKNNHATLATPGNFNTEIGLPKTLFQLSNEHRFAILELGARHTGDIKTLVDICLPQISCCLNIGSSHLDVFGSIENLARTKREIYNDPQALAVVNIDDDLLSDICETRPREKVVTFSTNTKSQKADVSLLSSTRSTSGEMNLHFRVSEQSIQITLPSYHHPYRENAAAAIAMAYASGLTCEQIKSGLETFSGVSGRFNVSQNAGLTIIDDTYNSHPSSVLAGLRTLSESYAKTNKILILGDMLELGPETISAHEKVGEACAKAHPNLLITVGPLSSSIASGAKKKGLDAQKILSFPHVDDVIAASINYKEFGDLLYIKASRGVALESLIESL